MEGNNQLSFSIANIRNSILQKINTNNNRDITADNTTDASQSRAPIQISADNSILPTTTPVVSFLPSDLQSGNVNAQNGGNVNESSNRFNVIDTDSRNEVTNENGFAIHTATSNSLWTEPATVLEPLEISNFAETSITDAEIKQNENGTSGERFPSMETSVADAEMTLENATAGQIFPSVEMSITDVEIKQEENTTACERIPGVAPVFASYRNIPVVADPKEDFGAEDGDSDDELQQCSYAYSYRHVKVTTMDSDNESDSSISSFELEVNQNRRTRQHHKRFVEKPDEMLPLEEFDNFGEEKEFELPPIEDLQITIHDETDLVEIGVVIGIVDKQVVIESTVDYEDYKPVQDDTVFFFEDRRPIGKVNDVFGNTHKPAYTVRFNTADDIQEKGIEIGLKVFFAPQPAPVDAELTHYIFNLAMMEKQRGFDNLHMNYKDVVESDQDPSSELESGSEEGDKGLDENGQKREAEKEGELPPTGEETKKAKKRKQRKRKIQNGDTEESSASQPNASSSSDGQLLARGRFSSSHGRGPIYVKTEPQDDSGTCSNQQTSNTGRRGRGGQAPHPSFQGRPQFGQQKYGQAWPPQQGGRGQRMGRPSSGNWPPQNNAPNNAPPNNPLNNAPNNAPQNNALPPPSWGAPSPTSWAPHHPSSAPPPGMFYSGWGAQPIPSNYPPPPPNPYGPPSPYPGQEMNWASVPPPQFQMGPPLPPPPQWNMNGTGWPVVATTPAQWTGNTQGNGWDYSTPPPSQGVTWAVPSAQPPPPPPPSSS